MKIGAPALTTIRRRAPRAMACVVWMLAGTAALAQTGTPAAAPKLAPSATPTPAPAAATAAAATPTPTVPRELRLKYDQDKKMVAVEALVVEVNEEMTRQLGLTYSFNQVASTGSSGPGTLQGGVATLGPSPTPVQVPILQAAAEGVSQVGFREAMPGLGVSLVGMDIGTAQVAARLRALLDRGDATVRTRPVAVGLNHTRLRIAATSQVPYQDITQDANKDGHLYVAYRDVGVVMEVTPAIVDTPPGQEEVSLDIGRLEVSSVSSFLTVQNVNRPVFSVSSTRTEVTLGEGETFVIGGLKTRRTVHSEDRVPILGSLWLIGYLFRSQQDVERDMDVLFFVTPYILSPGQNVFFPFDFKHQHVLEAQDLAGR